jgi:surfeit locus 1 family protein
MLLAVGLTFFLNLGFWQLRRAEFKTQMMQSFANASAQEYSDLDAALSALRAQRAQGLPTYVSVRVRGEFVPNKSLLWDSQRMDGKIGVQVYQAFRTRSHTLLVGLGFSAIDPNRLQFPEPPTAAGPLELRGILSQPPSAGLKLGEEAQAGAKTWLVHGVDPATQGDFFAASLLPYVLLLDPQTPLHNTRAVPAALQLPRRWNPGLYLTPEKHRGYALTWFGFAVTTLVLFFVLNRRRTPR